MDRATWAAESSGWVFALAGRVDQPAALLQERDGATALPLLVDGPGGRKAEEDGQPQAEHRGRGRPAAGPLDGPLEHGRAPGEDGLAVVIPLQVVGQRRRRDVAPGRVFIEAFQADGLQVRRDLGDEAGGEYDLVIDDLADGLDRGFPLERRPPGEQLVEDRPQRIHVRGRTHVPGVAAGLLGAM